MSSTDSSATEAAQTARAGAEQWRGRLAQVGLIGRGLLYGTLGLLVVQVATGDRQSASQQGAIERIARAPFGRFLLVVLVVTLLALVAWKVVQALFGDPIEGSEAFDRAKFAIKAVLYGAAAATAVSVLIANWGESSSGSSGSGGGSGNQQAAATVMEWPAGRWIVAAIGVGSIAYAAQQFYEHVVNSEFMQRVTTSSDTLELAGRVGYAGRAVVIAGVGVFFVIAGVTHDSDEAKGLSGLLQELSGNTWGAVLLWVIAIGLVGFGLFSLAESKFRRDT